MKKKQNVNFIHVEIKLDPDPGLFWRFGAESDFSRRSDPVPDFSRRSDPDPQPC